MSIHDRTWQQKFDIIRQLDPQATIVDLGRCEADEQYVLESSLEFGTTTEHSIIRQVASSPGAAVDLWWDEVVEFSSLYQAVYFGGKTWWVDPATLRWAETTLLDSLGDDVFTPGMLKERDEVERKLAYNPEKEAAVDQAMKEYWDGVHERVDAAMAKQEAAKSASARLKGFVVGGIIGTLWGVFGRKRD